MCEACGDTKHYEKGDQRVTARVRTRLEQLPDHQLKPICDSWESRGLFSRLGYFLVGGQNTPRGQEYVIAKEILQGRGTYAQSS